MPKHNMRPGVKWEQKGSGFAPTFKIKNVPPIFGAERPYPRFLEGEYMGVARYLMCKVCEQLFGAAPLIFPHEDEGDLITSQENPAFDGLPFMVEADNHLGWIMNDGNPDVLGMFAQNTQILKEEAIKHAATQTAGDPPEGD